jgi:hypothetical protein
MPLPDESLPINNLQSSGEDVMSKLIQGFTAHTRDFAALVGAPGAA